METIQEIDEAMIKHAITQVRVRWCGGLCASMLDAECKVRARNNVDLWSALSDNISWRRKTIVEWMRLQCDETWHNRYSEVLGHPTTEGGKANRIALLNKALEHFCPKSKEV